MGKLAYGMVAVVLLAPGLAMAQALKEQIVGTWRLVSIYNEDGSGKRQLFGDKPVGILMFDRAGNVVQFLSKPDVPKFAKANRLSGTDKEYRDAMQAIIAGFGSYTVEGDTVSIRWVGSSYPNRIGRTEKRTYQITGDRLDSRNPTAASGGTSHANYVRAKPQM
jgi:hypothetical protein